MDFSIFIKKISDVQAYIQNEKLLRELKYSVHTSEFHENEYQINKILRRLKKYWLGQFLLKMERKYHDVPSKFRFSDQNYSEFFLAKEILGWKDLKDAQQECLKKLDTDSFKQFCLNLKQTEKNNDFISFISLSIAPSIYNFFISAKNFMYLELIFEITDNRVKKKFVKTLFLIPGFINFVSTSFHPIFLPFENKDKFDFGDEKTFVESLLISWIDNMNLCPKLIRKYFENSVKQDSSIDEILIFFERLFENPDIFQITHFYNSQLPAIFFNENNRILQYLQENKNVVKKFVLSFFEKIDPKDDQNQQKITYRKDLEEQEINDEFTDIFLPYTFDSYDVNFLIDLINKKFDISKLSTINDLFESEYKLYIFSMDNEYSVNTEIPEQKPPDSFKNCILKLLEFSEILPDFPDSYMKENDPNFIENYLVFRGPFDTFSKRKKYFLMMKSLADDPLKKLMKMDLDELTNFDLKRDENIFSTALHRSIILNIQKGSFPVQSGLFQLLEYNFLSQKFNSMTQQKDFKALLEKVNTIELINGPKKLKELYDLYFYYFHNNDSYSSVPEFLVKSSQTDFKYTRDSYFMLYETKELTFKLFLNERRDLQNLDISFVKMVSSRNVEKNAIYYKLKDFFVALNLEYYGKDDQNSKKLKNLNKKFNLHANNMIYAFEADTNPLQKIIDICRTLAEMQDFIIDVSGAELEMGDIFAIRDLIITIVKPKNFVTSLIFIFDYYFMICDVKNDLKSLFEQLYSIAYRNTNKVLNDSLYRHLLICRENLKIVLFGDDSDDSIKKKILSEIENINGQSEVTYYYLKNSKYYVCSIETPSIVEKSDSKDQIDLAILAFNDESEEVFGKINSAKKLVKSRFSSSKYFKEFTYIVCNQSFHDKMKDEFSDKIFDYSEKVLQQIIDDYQNSILPFK
ncbi:hypothetical protein M9Y10_018150 [Tritrichomonas musculus]|uniref:Uncharacterized protein n=1 Tax=Tritrichomonas musculus TaxID=1915356 RepID=A0ABR2HMX4_9EUKA